MHDLEHIAILNGSFPEGGARHDLAVAFDRDLGRVKTQLPQHARDADAGRHVARVAVESDLQATVSRHNRHSQ
jgi:hypothetical protein